MSERYWMKEPCGPCPYSRSKTLPVHPDRAAEFAASACNPFTVFPCHKTADYLEETDLREGGFTHGPRSFECNGFLSLRHHEIGDGPEGFEPHPDAFSSSAEMVEKHTDLWTSERLRLRGSK